MDVLFTLLLDDDDDDDDGGYRSKDRSVSDCDPCGRYCWWDLFGGWVPPSWAGMGIGMGLCVGVGVVLLTT